MLYRKYAIPSRRRFHFHFYTAGWKRRVGFVVDFKYFGIRIITKNFTYLWEV